MIEIEAEVPKREGRCREQALGRVRLSWFVPSLGLFFEALQVKELDQEISYILLSCCRKCRRRAAWEEWVEGESKPGEVGTKGL